METAQKREDFQTARASGSWLGRIPRVEPGGVLFEKAALRPFRSGSCLWNPPERAKSTPTSQLWPARRTIKSVW